MDVRRKPVIYKQVKNEILKEMNFLKGIFSVMSLPLQRKDDSENQDFEIINNLKKDEEIELPKRARSIAELEEKLEKIKAQNNFNLKNKLVKKSLSSKLNKKIKKKERMSLNKHRVKGSNIELEDNKVKLKQKENITTAKPIFNNDGKLVFSKFDFAKVGSSDRKPKGNKDPKKILENLKQQEQKFQEIAEAGDIDKVKELKEKIAWKNTLQKAEGQKIKDDPTLLKKSIKRQEQKKKSSKKQWENRIKGVEQKKEDRQKKRKENIMKKKKEKKTKVVKAATKRGRVVI